MDFFECVSKRHSYRRTFRDCPLPRADIEKIVGAGVLAPTGCNKQTTQFVVVDDHALLRRVQDIFTMPAIRTAPVLIVCLINRKPEPAFNGNVYEIEDCAAAVQSMLMAITALGYASVWVEGGLQTDDKAEQLAQILGLPSSKVPAVMLPVGIPAEAQVRPEKLSLADRACWNGYFL